MSTNDGGKFVAEQRNMSNGPIGNGTCCGLDIWEWLMAVEIMALGYDHWWQCVMLGILETLLCLDF